MIELLQFRHSPYNEKVRWALDLKGVPHRRRSVLPGPHVPVVRKLTGRTHTPVLLTESGEALDGSARILDWLDAHFPEPRLTPMDVDQARAARAIEQQFDENLTPRARRAILATLLQSPSYFSAVFGDGASILKQRAYALAVPLAAPLIRRANGIRGQASIDDGMAAVQEALDFVASGIAQSGYLVGTAFSRADITAASMLAVVVRPEHSPMRAPTPVSSAYAALTARFAKHAAAAWVKQIYARHRGASEDFDGPSTLAGA